MQPPPLTRRSSLPLAIGVWIWSMAVLGVAAALGQPAILLGLVLCVVPLYAFADVTPTPAAVVRALESAGFAVGYDDSFVRVLTVRDRRVRISSPRAARRAGCFVLAIPHSLPLADHTWVSIGPDGLHTRHAPWDLRTQVVQAALGTDVGSARHICFTGETVEFWVPTTQAAEVARHLPDLLGRVVRLERAFVRQLVDAQLNAGIEVRAFTTATGGSLVFDGVVAGSPVQVRFGRFDGDTPAWRGRPELRVRLYPKVDETVFIGPCTRTLAEDLRSVVASG